MTKNQIKKVYLRILKGHKNIGVPSLKELSDGGVSRAELRKEWYNLTELEKEVFKENPGLFPMDHEVGRRTKVNKLETLERFAKFLKKIGRSPTRSDVISIGKEYVTRGELESHFGSLKKAEEQARLKFPEYFDDIPLSHISTKYTPKHLSRITNSKTLFITSFVTGQKVHEGFLASIKTFLKKNNAKLIIMPCEDPAHHKSKAGQMRIDYNLSQDPDVFILTDDLEINSNIFLSNTGVTAKQLDPAWGIGRLAQKYGSSIFASPKQRWSPVEVPDPYKPKELMTTGAITYPDYSSKFTSSQRTSRIAELDHVIGGMVIDIKDDNISFPRVVQADTESGHFVDMGLMYTPKKTHKVACEAMVLGDWHSGETEEFVKTAVSDACTFFSPKKGFTHDTFSGKSISHWERNNLISRAKLMRNSKMNLDGELSIYGDEVQWLSDKFGELLMVKSNHDLWLDQYLESGVYQKDPRNYETANKLVSAMFEDVDPLQHYYENMYGEKDHNVTWLSMRDIVIIEGIFHNYHGHKGPSGKKSAPTKSWEKAVKKAVLGHGHHTEIYGGIFRVGTSSILDPDYAAGAPSKSSHSFHVTYTGGFRQIFFIFDGEWRVK